MDVLMTVLAWASLAVLVVAVVSVAGRYGTLVRTGRMLGPPLAGALHLVLAVVIFDVAPGPTPVVIAVAGGAIAGVVLGNSAQLQATPLGVAARTPPVPELAWGLTAVSTQIAALVDATGLAQGALLALGASVGLLGARNTMLIACAARTAPVVVRVAYCEVCGWALLPQTQVCPGCGRGLGPTWTPTHQVPAEGLGAWAVPDPRQQPVASLAGGLTVQATELRGDWVRVVCDNGWTGWVDHRRLAALEPADRS